MRLILIPAVAVILTGSLFGEGENRKLVTRVEPEYSELIARMQVRGTVKLKLYIAPDGAVQRVEYLSGNPLLGDAATKAAKKWKYEPGSSATTAVVEVTH